MLETRKLMFESTNDAIRIRTRQGEEPYPTSESQQVLNGLAKELLRQTKMSLTTDQTPLTKVAKTLSRQISFNIVIDAPSLEKAGKDADLPVTCELNNVPLFALLDHLCQQAGLSWHFHNEVVLITARPKG